MGLEVIAVHEDDGSVTYYHLDKITMVWDLRAMTPAFPNDPDPGCVIVETTSVCGYGDEFPSPNKYRIKGKQANEFMDLYRRFIELMCRAPLSGGDCPF